MTPMMKQFQEIKERYPDAILFFRAGDFYEMFFDDAVLASKELDLALTSRSKGSKNDQPPMCGVPYHAADTYIARLIAKGYKVAVCEQLEDPAQAKGIVRRDVVRVVTPGTVLDSTMLDAKTNNFLCAVFGSGDGFGAAFCDISTGELFVTPLRDQTSLVNEIARYMPSEMIVNETVKENEGLMDELKLRFSCMIEQADAEPEWEHSKELVLRQYHKTDLSEVGLSANALPLNALGMLLTYLNETQKMEMGHFQKLNVYESDAYMELDLFTRRNLELTETMRNKTKRGSLLWVLDRTSTAMGGRLLRSFLEKPLVNCLKIQQRLFAVDELVRNVQVRDDLIFLLKKVNDMERLIGKIVCKTANPRDLLSLRESLAVLPDLELTMYQLRSKLMQDQCMDLDPLGDVLTVLEEAIKDDAPISPKDGDIIRKGFDAEVDEYRDLTKNGRASITKIEQEERERTGIKPLKIGYNRVFGYYIEVTNLYKDQVPKMRYIRKQTLTNGERYITEELKEQEAKVLGAEERLKTREYALFCEVRDKVAAAAKRIQRAANVIALCDVMCSLAEVAAMNHYVMPEVDDSDRIEIKDGRHPVVEKLLKNELFVPNDTYLNNAQDRLLILTGPNMAGKSTYMRQVAEIVLMAQMGSFVPAASCKIGICDKIFTRVGASDDLASGQSTFMVEMTEVAAILKNATSKSLLIFDEIGRGTSTYDGLAIAWAVSEYVSDKKRLGARTLFATHYHELTELEDRLDCVKNYRIACKKHGDNIAFLRRIVRGGADESYGIEVSALAGLPKPVIKRAKEILGAISDGSLHAHAPKPQEKTDSMQVGIGDVRGEEIKQMLLDLDITTLTPIEAMNKLYELQNFAKK